MDESERMGRRLGVNSWVDTVHMGVIAVWSLWTAGSCQLGVVSLVDCLE